MSVKFGCAKLKNEFNLAVSKANSLAMNEVNNLAAAQQQFSERRIMMAESIMLNKSKDFAVEVIKICRKIKENKGEASLVNQLIRCATSIGANIHESKYAHSTADFIAKMQIALKECYETEYWLELLFRTECMSDEEYGKLNAECGNIRRMLISSINTVKSNNEGKQAVDSSLK